MKKKVLGNLKKILIVIMCAITLFFSMPEKSEASILQDVANVIMIIPDGIMGILNNQLASLDGVNPVTKIDINLKGWDSDTQGNLYNFDVTPYAIFTSGQDYDYHLYSDASATYTATRLPLLGINFFSDTTNTTSADILRPVVSTVYKALRNLVLALMLVVLLYVGIRIVISSAVSDQVKYKQWLVDWVVGICLVIAMQYIMSFLMNINDIIVKMLSGNENSYYISLSKLRYWFRF